MTEENSLIAQRENEVVSYDDFMHEREEISDLMDEAIVSVKDYRLNVKKAMSADIASTVRIQNQYGQFLSACERELHRKDLSEERRKEIIDSMLEASNASEAAGVESRMFQAEQLNRSSRLPWEIVGVMALIFVAGFGRKAIIRAVIA